MSTQPLTLSAPAAALATVLALGTSAGQARNYPTRPVRLVVPFPPAGSNDIVGSVVAAALGDRLGKQVVVDNRAGGNCGEQRAFRDRIIQAHGGHQHAARSL
ncbi:MAG: hypothetical protein V7640_2617 [Betaproteobacteria bacterium]